MPSKVLSSYQTPSEALSSHQTPSKVLSSHQTPSKALSTHQMPSEVLSSHQTPGEALSSHQMPSEALSSHHCHQRYGTPEKYVRIVKDMYDRAVTKIRSSVGVTEEIPVQVGLHQGSALSPYLFDLIMDILTEDVRKRAPWCMMFADDVVLCEQSAEDLEIELEKWKNALEERGVRINRPKTVQLNFGMDEGQRVHLDGEELNVVDKFKYLGSMIDKEGELDCEIAHRVAAAWMNWKRMTGV
ncbi:hypothetical protein WDU94_007671 [Cyamophila willieti]